MPLWAAGLFTSFVAPALRENAFWNCVLDRTGRDTVGLVRWSERPKEVGGGQRPTKGRSVTVEVRGEKRTSRLLKYKSTEKSLEVSWSQRKFREVTKNLHLSILSDNTNEQRESFSSWWEWQCLYPRKYSNSCTLDQWSAERHFKATGIIVISRRYCAKTRSINSFSHTNKREHSIATIKSIRNSSITWMTWAHHFDHSWIPRVSSLILVDYRHSDFPD